MELLWKARDGGSSLPDAGSTSAPSSAATTLTQAKHKLGKDIVKDYETVLIGQSAYFTGTLVSTCFFQLWLAGLVVGGLITTLLHPTWWKFVGENVWWPISIAITLAWHACSQIVLNKYVTDGKVIRRPFLWLFAYVALSAAYCVVSVLLALMRLIQLSLTSIIALSRLDACLFTVLRRRDRGYASFLAMALMLHSLKTCIKSKTEDAASGDSGGATAAIAARRASGKPPLPPQILRAGSSKGSLQLPGGSVEDKWREAAALALRARANGDDSRRRGPAQDNHTEGM